MSELVVEVALRFGKVVLAGLVGIVIYAVVVDLMGATGSPQLALEAWIAGALVLLLLENSAF
jgi:uncharacterized membrane protein YdcZ (DUF606 family)